MPKKTGTPAAFPYAHFSTQQLDALDKMRDGAYALKIAKKKYVNHLLWPDGSVTDDVSEMSKAAKDDEDKLSEIDVHVAQSRFLFVVDADGLPVVYFQCVTPTNPDLPPLAEKEK